MQVRRWKKTQRYRDGSESHPKVNNANFNYDNNVLTTKNAEEPQAKRSDIAGFEQHPEKQNESSSSGTDLAQSNDAEIRIDEKIVTLTQNKNLKRLVEPNNQESVQAGDEMLQPKVASNPEGEIDSGTSKDQAIRQDELPVPNSQIQTQQVAEKHEGKQLQGGSIHDLTDQQNVSVINRANTADITPKMPRDENAILGREESESKTIAVEEENNLAVSIQDKPTPLPQALNDQASPKNLQQRVDQFFLGYIDAYNQRNIRIFTNYFNDNAVENGKPFQKMQPVYDELFEATKAVTLQINDRELHQEEENIVVEGIFEVFLQYKDNRKVSGSGPIIFILVDRENQLTIQNLSYKFN